MSTPPRIDGVATGTTGLVGRAPHGPVSQAMLVTSLADYERVFGGAQPGHELFLGAQLLTAAGAPPARRRERRSPCGRTRDRALGGQFLERVFQGGAFASRIAAESYFVRCGLDTTTQRDIENGVVNVEVGFAPLRPAEFVVSRIRHHFD